VTAQSGDIIAQVGIERAYQLATGHSTADAKRAGDELRIRCPDRRHDDVHPDADLNTRKNTWHCKACNAGGGWIDLILAAGVDLSTQGEERDKDDRPLSERAQAVAWLQDAANIERERCTGRYYYCDEHGETVYRVRRIEPGPDGKRKTFRQGVPDGGGRWTEKRGALNGIVRVPYRLPELRAAIDRAEPRIYVVEGERDVETIVAAGLVATTSAQGAAWRWTVAFVTHFAGAKCVVVVSDSDAAGRKAATSRASLLSNVCEDVRLVDLAPGRHDGYDVSDWIESGHRIEELLELIEATPRFTITAASIETPPQPQPVLTSEPAPDADTIRALVFDLRTFVRRFVVLSDEAALTVALWIVHTHAFASAEATPYLSIGSALKQCGKTLLLEVLELVVAVPWFTARTSAAALVRKIEAAKPTLLLDETDAAFSGEKEYQETLRGILNAGYRRGGVTFLCVGRDHEVRGFGVYCPKALAGIGNLPDTIADRAIRIELERRLPDETVDRFRRRLITPEADALRARVERYARAVIQLLRDASPELPAKLSDRAQDVWEPLLAIADYAELGDEARKAAVKLSARGAVEDDDLGVRILRDVQTVFGERDVDRITSVALVGALIASEDPAYAPDRRGREFDVRVLSRRLKPFRIHPETIRYCEKGSSEEKRAKGYMRAEFANAWRRYTATGGLFTDTDKQKREQESAGESSSEASFAQGREQREQRVHPYPVSVSSVNGQRERTREQDNDDTPATENEPPFTLFTDVTDVPETERDASDVGPPADEVDGAFDAVPSGLAL